MKSILLDTSAYSALLAGDSQVFDVVTGAQIVYLSVFVLGELHAGFRGGRKERDNRERLAAFMDKPTVKILLGTPDTAEIFGKIKDRLRKAGTPIPINDVWIAAHAIQSGTQVITFDEHFKKVSGLWLWERSG